jgi:hypothetical protein
MIKEVQNEQSFFTSLINEVVLRAEELNVG